MNETEATSEQANTEQRAKTTPGLGAEECRRAKKKQKREKKERRKERKKIKQTERSFCNQCRQYVRDKTGGIEPCEEHNKEQSAMDNGSTQSTSNSEETCNHCGQIIQHTPRHCIDEKHCVVCDVDPHAEETVEGRQ